MAAVTFSGVRGMRRVPLISVRVPAGAGEWLQGEGAGVGGLLALLSTAGNFLSVSIPASAGFRLVETEAQSYDQEENLTLIWTA